MPLLALSNPKVWLELALAAAVAWCSWYTYNWIYDRGADSVQRKWDAVELERAQQSAKVASDALKITKDLQTSADKAQEATSEQIKTLNSSLASAIVGLRNRPTRPDSGSVPVNPGAGRGCTGAELYKPDAEFLAREAARADALQIELKLCYDRYQAARNALK